MKTGRGASWLLILLEILILVVVVVLGVAKGLRTDDTSVSTEGLLQNTENFVQISTEETEVPTETEPDAMETWNASITGTDGFSEEVLQQLSEMTVEEKVAQMFLVTPEALTNNEVVTIAGAGTRNALSEYPVGGFVYAETNFQGRQQFNNLLSGAQRYSREDDGLNLILAIRDESIGNGLLIGEGFDTEPVTAAMVDIHGNSENAEWEGLQQTVMLTEEENPTDVAFMTYENLVITSELTDAASAVAAVTAGADFLYVTDEFQAAYDAVCDAVEYESISIERLDNAVGHILTRKAVMSEEGTN